LTRKISQCAFKFKLVVKLESYKIDLRQTLFIRVKTKVQREQQLTTWHISN